MKISEMNKITRHYDKYFQQTDALVIHPNFEAKLHVDALLYQPTKTFPFWKLATMGASDYVMLGRHTLGSRNEYMLFIDPSVDMTDKEVASKYSKYFFARRCFP
ncbi:unknown [Corallococcus sp. CAG:1435]|nr:unknown [Corallococcus sp. CAG:1435]